MAEAFFFSPLVDHLIGIDSRRGAVESKTEVALPSM